MEHVPYELFFEILLKVRNIKDVLAMCSTNSFINKICSDDYFWQRRFIIDYPKLKDITPGDNITFKQLYEWVYSTGIGHSLCIIPDLNRSVIPLLNPKPQYDISRFTNVKITDIGGETYYRISPDSVFFSVNGKWRRIDYPRGSTVEQRQTISRSQSFVTYNTLNEVINDINKFISQGYYILCDSIISDKKLKHLHNNGMIGTISEFTRVEHY